MTTTPPTGLRVWWLAIRPRTLPAAVAPIATGSAVAIHEGAFDPAIALSALVVALLLQIIANLANDLFDFKRGADKARVGPTRVTQSGLVTPRAMSGAIAVTVALAIAAGLYLVWQGGWPILLLGALAILAALAYTAGPFPLGYHGLGDLFVFLFFGLAGVTGCAWLQTGELTRLSLLAALPVGLLATAIIVVNNLRDLETDRAAGKRTLATRIGRAATIAEYRLLLAVSYAVAPLLWLLGDTGPAVLLVAASLPLAWPFARDIAQRTGPALNPLLGGTARLTLVYALLFAVGIAL